MTVYLLKPTLPHGRSGDGHAVKLSNNYKTIHITIENEKCYQNIFFIYAYPKKYNLKNSNYTTCNIF